MFVLCEMQDVIRVVPHLFKNNMQRQIADELNKKLANKVVYDVGLVIAFQDLLDIGDSFILPGDGSSHTRVKFRAVVFRPFIGEILVGIVRRCSPEGVHVSVGFFHDILIPKDYLPYPSTFDMDEQLWVWQYEGGDTTHPMYIEIDSEIRFKVLENTFVDTAPKSEPSLNPPLAPNPGLQQAQALAEKDEQKPPYSITGAANESGLGLLSWWN